MTDLYDAQDYLPHQTRADDLIRRGDFAAFAQSYWQKIGGGMPEGPADEAILATIEAFEQAIAALPAVAAPGVRGLMRQAYLHGFSASAEGYNREYPFDDKGVDPEKDEEWQHDRECALDRVLGALDTPAPALMDELVEALRGLEATCTAFSVQGVTVQNARAVLAKMGGA